MNRWLTIFIVILIILIVLAIISYIGYFGIDSLYSLEYAENYAKNNPHKCDIIISFTTLPSRANRLETVIKSLLFQDLCPQLIIINTPLMSKRERCAYIIPPEISSLYNVKINTIDRDWGPATKFIPSILTLEDDQKILIIDDDVIFPRDFITHFYNMSLKYPNSALTTRGANVIRGKKWSETITVWGDQLSEPKIIDTTTGFGGILVKPRFFDKEALINYDDAPKEAFFVDDIWISGWLSIRNISKIVIPTRQRVRHAFILDDNTLSSKENSNGHNNDVMILWFSNYWHY